MEGDGKNEGTGEKKWWRKNEGRGKKLQGKRMKNNPWKGEKWFLVVLVWRKGIQVWFIKLSYQRKGKTWDRRSKK